MNDSPERLAKLLMLATIEAYVVTNGNSNHTSRALDAMKAIGRTGWLRVAVCLSNQIEWTERKTP